MLAGGIPQTPSSTKQNGYSTQVYPLWHPSVLVRPFQISIRYAQYILFVGVFAHEIENPLPKFSSIIQIWLTGHSELPCLPQMPLNAHQPFLSKSLRSKFLCSIKKWELNCTEGQTAYYNVLTDCGRMTLLVENIQLSNRHPDWRYQLTSIPQIAANIPLIYEQTTHSQIRVEHHENPMEYRYTLMEPIKLYRLSQLQSKTQSKELPTLELESFKKVLRLLDFLESLQLCTPFRLTDDYFLYFSESQEQFHLNFSSLFVPEFCQKAVSTIKNSELKNRQNPQHQDVTDRIIENSPRLENRLQPSYMQAEKNEIANFEMIQVFLKLLSFYLPPQPHLVMIKHEVMAFCSNQWVNLNPKSWFELCVTLNFSREVHVSYRLADSDNSKELSESKQLKKKAINKLKSGTYDISRSSNYQHQCVLPFMEGVCTKLYEVCNSEYLRKIFCNCSQLSFLKLNDESAMIGIQVAMKGQSKGILNVTVESGVSKSQAVEVVSKLFQILSLTVEQIAYDKRSNLMSLRAVLGSQETRSKVVLRFDKSLSFRDEELILIIEKSKLENLHLKISEMKVTDKFLMFLANSKKTSNIQLLDLSQCRKLTENSLDSMLITPFFKRLETLDISNTFLLIEELETLCKKSHLKVLKINHCKFAGHKEVNLENLSLQTLQALGVNCQPSFFSGLKTLKLDCQFDIFNLKFLQKMQLKQLSLRLVQQKKTSLPTLFESLIPKENEHIRRFSEGKSRFTIRRLQLFGEKVKPRQLKLMLQMPRLEELVLTDWTHFDVDYHICPNIKRLLFERCCLPLKDLNNLTKGSKAFEKVDLSETQLTPENVWSFLFKAEKMIGELTVTQSQVGENILNPLYASNELVKKLKIHIEEQNPNYGYSRLPELLYKISRLHKVHEFVSHSEVETKRFFSAIKSHFGLNYALLEKVLLNQQTVQEAQREFSTSVKSSLCPPLLKESNPASLGYLQIQSDLKEPIRISLCRQNRKQATLSLLTYTLTKSVLRFPNALMELSLKENRTITVEALKMVKKYCRSQKIRSIDVRGTMVSCSQVLELFCEWPFFESANAGHYQIEFAEKNFVPFSSNLLKFFMRILGVQNFALVCSEVPDANWLFSVLFHIFDHHSDSLREVSLHFSDTKGCANSRNFWSLVLGLTRVTTISIKLENCPKMQVFSGDSRTKAPGLWPEMLSCSIYGVSADHLVEMGQNCQDLRLNLQRSQVTEAQILSLLSGCRLKRLSLNCDDCPQLTHIGRILHSKALGSVEHLELSFQLYVLCLNHSCELKDSAVGELLSSLSQLNRLSFAEVDLSYSHSLDASSAIQSLRALKFKNQKPFIRVYLIGQLIGFNISDPVLKESSSTVRSSNLSVSRLLSDQETIANFKFVCNISIFHR